MKNTTPDFSDPDLIEALKSNDRMKHIEVYRFLRVKVFFGIRGRLRGMGMNPKEEDLKDAYSDALADLWLRVIEGRIKTRNIQGLLFTVTRNKLIDKQKGDWREPSFSSQLDAEKLADSIEASEDNAALEAEQYNLYQECLSQLSSLDKKLYQLRYVQRKKLVQIAVDWNETEGKLKMKMHRIRKRLTECVHGKLDIL